MIGLARSLRRFRARGALGALLAVPLVFGSAAAAGAAPAWSIVPVGTTGSVLFGTSCVSTKACTAVGFSAGGGLPLIESSTGAGWKVVPSPSLGGGFNRLQGVSCVSTTSCVAVGWGEIPGTSGSHRTMIESWNGKKWVLVSSPNRGRLDNDLNAVSCVSAKSCVAVGSWLTSTLGDHLTLVESWNGSVWTIDTSSPNVPSTVGTKINGVEDSLNGVSCAKRSSCMAVGSYEDTRGFDRTLTESWNGTSWSVAKSPNHDLTGNALAGVSCDSTKECEAVGTYGGAANGGAGVPRVPTESWNGSVWSKVTSPNPGKSVDALAGVSCAAAKSCRAVGYYQKTSGGPYLTLIEAWHGGDWNLVTSPNPSPAGPKPEPYHDVTGSGLNGISCISTTSCHAVGWHDDNGQDQTLIEAYG